MLERDFFAILSALHAQDAAFMVTSAYTVRQTRPVPSRCRAEPLAMCRSVKLGCHEPEPLSESLPGPTRGDFPYANDGETLLLQKMYHIGSAEPRQFRHGLSLQVPDPSGARNWEDSVVLMHLQRRRPRCMREELREGQRSLPPRSLLLHRPVCRAYAP